ncbi:MAG TPA: TonB-dependent receptor [Bacteroidota bacterium]|nr:TonB-dependent receptor [Bacteroidota bacterium]
MHKPISILLLLFLAATAQTLAQKADIRGVVTDSVTGQRLPYANVSIVGTARGSVGNGSGFYLIPSLPPGQYDIAATVVGYHRGLVHVTLFPGKSIDVNFQLVSQPIENQEVLVTAPRKRELSEINTSVHVLEQKELKMAPVSTQEDVFQSLKILPGIVSTSDVSSRFYVRGGAGDQNLVLFDGVKIYNPFHALGIFSIFDPDILQQVEVHTGAYPASYGGRLSSVINMSTRDGRADHVAGAANLNFLSSKLQLEGPLYAGSSWMVNVRKSLFSETFKRIVNQDVPVSFYDGFIKFTHQFKQGTKVDIDFLGSEDVLNFAAPEEPNYSWRGNTLLISASDLVGDRLFANVVVYNTFYRAERFVKASTVATPSSSLIKEPGLRVSANLYTDSGNLYFFGFEFSFPIVEYVLTNNVKSTFDLYSEFADVTGWVGYQAKYDRLQVDVGGHVDLGALFNGELGWGAVQPRLNVSYLLFGNCRAKASFGTISQRSVTVSNEDDIISIWDPWIKIPSNIGAEQAVHSVLGLEWSFLDHYSATLEAYHKHYNNLVVYNRDKVDATEPDYISGTGNSSGVELLLRAGFPFADFYAAYSLAWTSLDNAGFTYYPRYDRRHHLNLLATTHLLKDFDLSARWEFGSGFPFTQSTGFYDRLNLLGALPGPFELETGDPYLSLGAKNAARLPSYHRLDLSIAYRFVLFGSVKGTIGGQVMNAYDHKNMFYFDRKTGERVDMLRLFPTATVTIQF